MGEPFSAPPGPSDSFEAPPAEGVEEPVGDASAPATELAPGTSLGPYTVIGLLARGGMAEIYLALAEGQGVAPRPVVVKRVLPHLPGHDDPSAMFADEAALSSRLHHPNVVEMLDLVEREGDLLIVFEHLHGADTHEMLTTCDARKIRLPIEVAIQVVAEAAAGLHHAHELTDEHGQSQKVIHRDVSPQNVFVTFDGLVKVLDFGLAKSVFRTAQTRSGAAKGKLSYMSPEQLLGKPLDRRTDVFALGIVLYELSLGIKLYDVGRGEMQVVREILEGRVTPPREIDPAYPAAVEAVVMRALAKRPDERFPTAHAFRRALAEAARASGLMPSHETVRQFIAALYPDRVVDTLEVGPPAAIPEPVREEPPIVHETREARQAVPAPVGARSERTQRVKALTFPPLAASDRPAPRSSRRRWSVLAAVAGSAAVVAVVAAALLWLLMRSHQPVQTGAGVEAAPAPAALHAAIPR